MMWWPLVKCLLLAATTVMAYSTTNPFYFQGINTSTECGVIPQTKIYGDGSRTAFGEHPWQAAILANGKFLCSGALLSDKYVVTAASCIHGTPEAILRIRLGDWNILGQDKCETYNDFETSVDKIYVHPKFRLNGKDYTYHVRDVAILQLSKPVDFNSYPQVRPVCLPEKTTYLKKASCFAAGWSESATKVAEANERSHESRLFGDRAFDYSSPLGGYYPHPAWNRGHWPYPQSPTSRKILERTGLLEMEAGACSKLMQKEGFDQFKLSYGQTCRKGELADGACKVDLGAPVTCLLTESVPAGDQGDYLSHGFRKKRTVEDLHPLVYNKPRFVVSPPSKMRPKKRAVLVEIVSYSPSCFKPDYSPRSSYGYGLGRSSAKVLLVTSVKDVLDWIVSIIHA